MNVVKVGKDRHINLDRMTHAEPWRKGALVVHFAVGGGEMTGPSCRTVLKGAEAEALRRWLDVMSENAESDAHVI